MKSIDNKELLAWINKNIERARRNAMHAHMRGDSTAFENINKELAYWMQLASVMEEMTENEDKEEDEQNGDADI